MTMPFTEQLDTIAPYITAAARQVCPSDIDPEDIARLAIERFAGIGALEHGDAMFHLTSLELLAEEAAEYADAVVYRARRMALAQLTRPIVVPFAPLTDEQAEGIRRAWREKFGGKPLGQIMREEMSAQITDEILHGRRTEGYDVDESAEAPDPSQGDA